MAAMLAKMFSDRFDRAEIKPPYRDRKKLSAVMYMKTSHHGFLLTRMCQQYGSKEKEIMSFGKNIAILVVATETTLDQPKSLCFFVNSITKKICNFFCWGGLFEWLVFPKTTS